MLDEELKKLYQEKQRLEYQIEMERTKRNQQGIDGMSPDFFEYSIERETSMEEKLANVLTDIKNLESQNNDVVPFGGKKQNDFINGIDEDKIIKDVLGKMGLNSNGNAKIEIQKGTTIKVIEDIGNNQEDVQTFKKSDLESIHTIDGQKISHDKSSTIDFTLEERKDGKTVNETTKRINVAINDYDKNDNRIVYNEVKQLESSPDIVIDAKKVEEDKKGFNPKVKVKYGRNKIHYR